MAISEACKFEIRDEVDKMITEKKVDTKAEAFQKMREFYKSIGVEIKEDTIKRKYYRAQDEVTNVTSEENPTKTDDNPKLEKLEKKQHGGARAGAGRKPKSSETEHLNKAKKVKTATTLQDGESSSEAEGLQMKPTFAEIHQEAERQLKNTFKFVWENHPGSDNDRISCLRKLCDDFRAEVDLHARRASREAHG